MIYQSYNKRNKAYVKYKKKKGRCKIMNVKERNPGKPFKGVKIKKRKR